MATKVRFTATIEIEPQEWAAAYGMDPKGVRAIQDDVRAAVLNAIQQMPVPPVAVTQR
jgi:TolB-like protein